MSYPIGIFSPLNQLILFSFLILLPRTRPRVSTPAVWVYSPRAPLFPRCYFNETQTKERRDSNVGLVADRLKIIGRLGSGGVAVGSIPRRAEGPLGRRITVRQPSRQPRQDMRLRTVGTPHLRDDLRQAGIADGVNVDARGHGVAGSGALETQLAHSFVSRRRCGGQKQCANNRRYQDGCALATT